MRILCEQCSAAYAVDDRLIGARGVRAQCPRCRHLQFVDRDSEQAPDDMPPAVTPVSTPAVLPGAAFPTPPPRASVTVDDSLLTTQDSAAACKECGKALDDPFDRALGSCDECRAKAQDAAPADAETALPEQPQVTAPAPAKPRVAPAPRTLQTATRPGASPSGSGRPWMAVGGVALAGLLLGGGVVAWRAGVFSRPAAPKVDPHAGAIDAVLGEWRLAFVDVTGTAAEHLAKGDALLRDDLLSSYIDAAETFQKALLLDPSSDAAIAGYVRAVALGHGTRMGDAQYEQALSLINVASARSRSAPRVLLAKAHLLLSRPRISGNLEEARAIAEGVQAREDDGRLDADAYLVVGRSWQRLSSPLAIRAFSAALELDAELKIALYQRALAYEGAGDHAAALRDLEARLKLNPDHWSSTAQLAQIYRRAGKVELAEQLFARSLKAHPDDVRPKVHLAILRYQAQGRVQEALGTLRQLAKTRDSFEEHEQFQIFTHLAAAERVAGNDNAAVEAAREAIRLAPEDPSPHVQLFLVASARGLSTDAATHLAAIEGRLEEPALEKLFLGRLRMMESRWADAEAAFQKAAALDSRRTDALLLAGVSAIRANKKDAAFRHLLAAAAQDPLRASPPPEAEGLYFRPEAFLAGAAEAVASTREGGQDELTSRLVEAVVRYHLREDAQAVRLLRQVVEVDSENALAQAWRAFVLLRQRDLASARLAADKAVSAGRTLPLAHYAQGAVLEAQGVREGARRALLQALELDRSFLGAELLLASLEARQKDEASARVRLVRAVTQDPAFEPARQLLFTLGEGGRP